MSARKNFSSLLNTGSSGTPQSARKREETKEYQEFLASRAAKAKQKQKGNTPVSSTSAQQTPKKQRSSVISSIMVTPSNNKSANAMDMSSLSKDTKVTKENNTVMSTPVASTPLKPKASDSKRYTKIDQKTDMMPDMKSGGNGGGGTSLEDKIAASLATPISSMASPIISSPQTNTNTNTNTNTTTTTTTTNNNNRSYPTSPSASVPMGLSREEKERYEEELEQKVQEAETQAIELKQLREHITKLSLQLEEKDSTILLKNQQLNQAQEEVQKAVQEKALSKEEVDSQLTRLLDSKAVSMSVPSSSFFSQKVISWLHRSGYGEEEKRDYDEGRHNEAESRSRSSSLRILPTGGAHTHAPEYVTDIRRSSGRFESALDDKISSVIAAEKEAGVNESVDTGDDMDGGDDVEEEEEEDDDDDLDITASVVHVETVSPSNTSQSISEEGTSEEGNADGKVSVNAGELSAMDKQEDMEEALQQWEAQVGLRDGKSRDKVEKHVRIDTPEAETGEKQTETEVDTEVTTEVETEGDTDKKQEKAPQKHKKAVPRHSYKQNKLLQEGGNDSSFFHSDNASEDDSDSEGSVDSAFGASGVDVNTLVTHPGDDPLQKLKTIKHNDDSGSEDDDMPETFTEKQFIPQYPGSQNLIIASDLYVILLQELLELRAELHMSA